MTYNEFVKESEVIISEEEFNEIITSLPEYDYNISGWPDFDSVDSVTEMFINEVLENNFKSVIAEDIDFDNKTFCVVDAESVEDLKEIVKLFKGWTISNFEEAYNIAKENESLSERDDLVMRIKNYASIEELKEICTKYDY